MLEHQSRAPETSTSRVFWLTTAFTSLVYTGNKVYSHSFVLRSPMFILAVKVWIADVSVVVPIAVLDILLKEILFTWYLVLLL